METQYAVVMENSTSVRLIFVLFCSFSCHFGVVPIVSPKTGLFRPVFLSGEWLNFLGAKIERVKIARPSPPVPFLLRENLGNFV